MADAGTTPALTIVAAILFPILFALIGFPLIYYCCCRVSLVPRCCRCCRTKHGDLEDVYDQDEPQISGTTIGGHSMQQRPSVSSTQSNQSYSHRNQRSPPQNSRPQQQRPYFRDENEYFEFQQAKYSSQTSLGSASPSVGNSQSSLLGTPRNSIAYPPSATIRTPLPGPPPRARLSAPNIHNSHSPPHHHHRHHQRIHEENISMGGGYGGYGSHRASINVQGHFVDSDAQGGIGFRPLSEVVHKNNTLRSSASLTPSPHPPVPQQRENDQGRGSVSEQSVEQDEAVVYQQNQSMKQKERRPIPDFGQIYPQTAQERNPEQQQQPTEHARLRTESTESVPPIPPPKD